MNIAAAPQTMAEIKERALQAFETSLETPDWLTLREIRDTLKKAIEDTTSLIDVTHFMTVNPALWELPSLSMNGFKPSIRGVVMEAIATNIMRSMPGATLKRFNEQFENKLEPVLKSLVETALTSFDRRPGSEYRRHELYNNLCCLKIALNNGLDRGLVIDAVKTLSEFRDDLPNSEPDLSKASRRNVSRLVDSLKTVLDDDNALDELFPVAAPTM